jgi:hypothetical protein
LVGGSPLSSEKTVDPLTSIMLDRRKTANSTAGLEGTELPKEGRLYDAPKMCM